MSEVTLRLPEEVTLVEVGGHESPLDIGRLAIVGYVGMEFFLPEELRPQKEDVSAAPYPLLLVDGLKVIERNLFVGASREHMRMYYGLEPDIAQERWVVKDTQYSQAIFPENDGPPYAWIGNASVPPKADILFFKEPIPYEQKPFEQAVLATQEY